MRASVLLASLLLGTASVPAMAQDTTQTPAAAKPAPGPMDAKLRALYDAEWDWRQKELA